MSDIKCSSATDFPTLKIADQKKQEIEEKQTNKCQRLLPWLSRPRRHVKTCKQRRHTHSLGFRKTSSIWASRDPLAGSCMYSHLRERGGAGYRVTWAASCCRSSRGTLLLPGGEGERHQNALDPGAGRGQAKLHSPVVHQVELHVSATESQIGVM